MKRKNTRAPCRIRREGITCRGVVPFVFRRRRDVLFFSFFLKKRDWAVAVSFFCFSGELATLRPHLKTRAWGGVPSPRRNLPPYPVFPSPPCRGRACPARSLPPNPFYNQSVGEGFIPPAHLPAAVNGHGGQRAGRPTTPLKNPCVGRGALTPPPSPFIFLFIPVCSS